MAPKAKIKVARLYVFNFKKPSTGCPNKFGIRSEMFASEASIVYKKVCILLQKIAFSAFFVNCKNW